VPLTLPSPAGRGNMHTYNLQPTPYNLRTYSSDRNVTPFKMKSTCFSRSRSGERGSVAVTV